MRETREGSEEEKVGGSARGGGHLSLSLSVATGGGGGMRKGSNEFN